MLTFDTTINLPMLGAGFMAVVFGARWVQGIVSRVEILENSDKELSSKQTLQTKAVEVLSDAINALRMDLVKSYASLEYLRTVERKVESVGVDVSEVKVELAALSATIDFIKESQGDIKRILERRDAED